jgi:uncharacterized membrane-anchored protein YhcB (DUF1043 family)
MEDFFKKVKPEHLLNFLVGIILGLLIILCFKQLRLSNTQQSILDKIKADLNRKKLDAVKSQTKNTLQSILDKIKADLEGKKLDAVKSQTKNTFPLKKGSTGEEVAALHKYLIDDYGAEIGAGEINEKLFGETTFDLVKTHLKRDKISENYFNKAILITNY